MRKFYIYRIRMVIKENKIFQEPQITWEISHHLILNFNNSKVIWKNLRENEIFKKNIYKKKNLQTI